MDALLQSKRKKGRKGDKVIAHLTPGEVVIPRELVEDDDFRRLLAHIFKENGGSLEKYIVGSGKNSINPKTGYMEFGWDPFRPAKKLFKSAKKRIKRSFENIMHIPEKTMEEIGRAITPSMPKIEIPELPPLTTTIEARGLGGADRRRRRRRRLYTTPGYMAPAMVERRGLKTTFG